MTVTQPDGGIRRGATIALVIGAIAVVAVIAAAVGIPALLRHQPSEASPAPSSPPASSASSYAGPQTTSMSAVQQQSEVLVFNRTGPLSPGTRATINELKAANFNVTYIGTIALPDVTDTTVYFTDADGERATADAVGMQLGASVKPRIPAVASLPPGVIVVLPA